MGRKRDANSLVAYSDSSDEEQTAIEEPLPKKKKLPSLSSSLTTQVPVDNPALHQGRIRTTPHVEGQFSAHIYICIYLKRHFPLYKLLVEAIGEAKKISPTLREFWSVDDEVSGSSNIELHISLSRPIYLRPHQREDLKRAVNALSRHHKPFDVSFVQFSELINDEKTRTFLTMEIGAGHKELHALSNALTPILSSIRQKEYYASPRFHASIAWALLDRPPDEATEVDTKPPELSSTSTPLLYTKTFPKISCLPKNLIPALNERYATTMSSRKVGVFHVEQISVKIGKDISSWRLTLT